MNKKEKDKYKELLIEKKKEIIDQLTEFHNVSKEVETGIAQDVGDKAESSYTKEFLLLLSDTERNELFLIDDALKRIDGNDFGKCVVCQKEIRRKRLSAIPWAPNCIECQEKEEEETA